MTLPATTKELDAERRRFAEFITIDAEPVYRLILKQLVTDFWEFNHQFFGGHLKEPHITFGITPPRSFAFCKPTTDWGASLQITVNYKIVFGGHKHVLNPWPADGTVRFVRDVLLHELIHQYQFEVTGKAESSYRGHGPQFAAICNDIGKRLGLPTVIARRRGRKDENKPVCTYWPINVRPDGYYAPDVNLNEVAAVTSSVSVAKPVHTPNWAIIFETFLALIEEGRIDDLKKILLTELSQLRQNRTPSHRLSELHTETSSPSENLDSAETHIKPPDMSKNQPDTTASYETIYQEIHRVPPPTRVMRKGSDADIFTNGRGFMAAFDYTMQTDVGCPAACQFCYVSTAFRLAPTDVQRNWGFEVRHKRNVSTKLNKHLEQLDLTDKTIYWSGVTDPYAAPPEVTRAVWTRLIDAPEVQRPRRIAIQTRFRPDRDLCLIANYVELTKPTDSGPPVVVSYSVGTDRDDLIRAWERATPSFESRLKSIKALAESGVWVVPTLSPFALWRDLQGTLSMFRQWGIQYITLLFFKDKTGATTTPKPFLKYLRETYPQLLDECWQAEQLSAIQEVFGCERVLVGKAGFSSLIAPHQVTH